jgi:hypothetical protein
MDHRSIRINIKLKDRVKYLFYEATILTLEKEPYLKIVMCKFCQFFGLKR